MIKEQQKEDESVTEAMQAREGEWVSSGSRESASSSGSESDEEFDGGFNEPFVRVKK